MAALVVLVAFLATATMASATPNWQDKVDAAVLQDVQDGNADFLIQTNILIIQSDVILA